MTVHVHHLWGCAPAPLAHYLKALGILRLVSEQKDASARGAWRDEHFVLWTSLDRAELERFFLEEYRPTPLVSPWNKGSGLMAANDPAVSAILGSRAPRLAAYRAAISEAKDLNEAVSRADQAIRKIKDEPKRLKGAAKSHLRSNPDYKARLAAAEREFRALKADLMPSCRAQWRGPHLDWVEAALVLTDEREVKFPALLGTGGNDGRLDMTNNSMQRLVELFDTDSEFALVTAEGASALSEALWSGAHRVRIDAAVGQFLPGAAGGANSTNGPTGAAAVNAWDFVLALEGTVAFRAAAARRFGGQGRVLASAPFAAFGHGAGHGSAAPSDEGTRGEQWMPLWTQATSWVEIQRLLGEGRAQAGRAPANRPLDLVRALTRLGVARGVSVFVRYGFIERNGQSNFAVALDRFSVSDRPTARLVDDLASWLERLRRRARERGAAVRLQWIERNLSDAVLDAVHHPDEPRRWQSVLLATSNVEALIVPGGSAGAGPIPQLQSTWVQAADDGSPEFRLALALGTARARVGRERWEGIRGHFLPFDVRGRLDTSGGLNPRVAASPRVVFSVGDPVDALLRLVERRLLEAEARGTRCLDLRPGWGTGASLADVRAFIDGGVDEGRVVSLARAFSALRLTQPAAPTRPQEDWPDEAWLALKLVHLPEPLVDRHAIHADPAIVRRLRAGDATSALELALRRLKGAGLHPPLRVGAAEPEVARRWGAALAFPIDQKVAERAAIRLFPRSKELLDAR